METSSQQTPSVNSNSTAEEFFVFPMSFQQEALWFLDQLQPGLPVYNVTICHHVRGLLDPEILAKAVTMMVDRHESLRTGFREIQDKVSQVIQKKYHAKLNHVVVEGSFDEAFAKAKEIARQGFDLSSKSLLNSNLIQYADDGYITLFSVHHIVFDGWSAGIFKKELTDIYNALIQARIPDLEEPEVQYADFAVWQRKWYETEAKDEQLAFWKENLGKNPEPLELPTDFVRPSKQSFTGDMVFIDLPKDLVQGLKQLSIKESSTLFMTLMSAFKILLSRYSGQDDISLGSPMAGRQGQELEQSIGYYVNTVVYRTDLSGNPSFRELLKRVRGSVLDVFDNQEMPFDKLVEEIKPDRGLSRNPLFQAMLALQSQPGYDASFQGVTSEPLRVGTGTSKFDLSIELKEDPDGIKGFLEYNTELFSEETATRLVANFQLLLSSIVADPDQAIGELEIIHPSERNFLLNEVNDTTVDYPRESLLHQLVEKQARQTPDNLAIQFGQSQLTYQELDLQSSKLASYLKQAGAGPEQMVGIYLDRGIAMVVGLLGILKSGAAYLPMDPLFPYERLQYMLDDGEAGILLTEERLKSDFPEFSGKVIAIDTDWEQILNTDSDFSGITIDSNALAYTIYTSGSTGKPKGVQIEHRSVVNFLLSMQREPGLSSSDTLLAVTTLSFDISILEIFLPLITGAKLLLVTKEQSMNGTFLLKTIKDEQVTVMQATPSTWRIMLDSGWDEKLDLKVLCGGEALPHDLAKQLIARTSSLWNVYGPTETTIWSTTKNIGEEDRITIGRPLNNTQVYITDPRGNLAPKGVIGELCIGGDGVARGYLNRPELTADRFIKNPWSNIGHARIYRTGDLARILNNGEIECLGRLDNQVKIRGYRIELGEIESSLSAHQAIRDCVVEVKGTGVLDSRLVGYLISEEDRPSVDELKALVKNQLPDYMVPTHLMFLDEFPKTSNGKIDRKNLPDPDITELQSNSEPTQAAGELEAELVGIWEKLLNVKPIGTTDNFFDLGGHSLLAARITFQIKKKLGIEIPLETLFKAQTIKELAQEISQLGWKPDKKKSRSAFSKLFKWK